MKTNDNKKRLRIIDIQRDGKGISKKEPLSPSGLKRFFLTYKDNFGKLISVNMFFVLGNFPLFFLIITLSGYTKLEAYLPLSDLYQNLGALFTVVPRDPLSMSLYALDGLQNQILVNTTLTYVFYGLSAITLLTFGCVNVGTAYILRNIAKGEPVFVWTDFWYAVRRNWKQALPFGAIDGIINMLLIFNLYTTTANTADFLGSMMFWGNIILMVLYFFMRSYIYVQMVTFNLSVFKILKNSLSFALLGFKRNVMALLGAAVVILFEVLFLFGSGGILLPLAIALPLAIMFSSLAYMKVYAAYFRIKDIMIDPYIAEHPELAESEPEDDVIMHDDVTERERLEEIKRRNGMI